MSSDSGAACPSLDAVYDVTVESGTCMVDATVDVFMMQTVCSVSLITTGGGGTPVTGTVALDASGGFTSATLTMGNVVRMDCDGTWTEGTGTLSIVCGAGPSSCSATLVRY